VVAGPGEGHKLERAALGIEVRGEAAWAEVIEAAG